jgi:hypothetical protein
METVLIHYFFSVDIINQRVIRIFSTETTSREIPLQHESSDPWVDTLVDQVE